MDKQDFAVMHGWMLKKVPNDELSKIKLAEVKMNGLTPLKITNERSLRLQDLNLIMTQIIDTSYLQSSRIQYLGFDEIIKAFIQHTKLDEKGRFSLREDVLTSMAAINSFFAAILVAGHRLIETCEKSIKASFGKDSKEYSIWKRMTGYLFNNTLVYMLANRLRNTYEHDYLILNYISLDEDKRTAYAVLDLDHELLGKNNIPTKHRPLQDFLDETKSQNSKPKIGIGFFITTFFAQVRTLYFYYSIVQSIRLKDLRARTSKFFQQGEKENFCLIAKDINKIGFPEIGIFYIHPLDNLDIIDGSFDMKGLKDLNDLLERIDYQ